MYSSSLKTTEPKLHFLPNERVEISLCFDRRTTENLIKQLSLKHQ